MIVKRMEECDLAAINEIRNDNLKFIRQYKEQNMKEQKEWFNTTNDIYFSLFREKFYCENDKKWFDLDKPKLCGAIGLTQIDYISRKSELSLITIDYIDKKYAKPALEFIYDYAFRYLGMNKIYCPCYEFDDKKRNLFMSEYWDMEATLLDDIFFGGQYWNSKQYCIFGEDYLNNENTAKI